MTGGRCSCCGDIFIQEEVDELVRHFAERRKKIIQPDPYSDGAYGSWFSAAPPKNMTSKE